MTAVPADLLDPVVASVDPVEVWLFGSRARGEARPDSDWDLYVVVDDAAGEDAWNKGYGATRPFRIAQDVGVDLIVQRWSKSLARRRAFGTLDEIVDHEGERVYARRVTPPVQDIPEISSPAEWLDRGRGDAKVAGFAIANELFGHAGFNIQQAWEKALKGRLALAHVRVRKTHDLKELAALVGGFDPAEAARLAEVSKWGLQGRYGAYPENDVATLEAELAKARFALDVLEAALKAS